MSDEEEGPVERMDIAQILTSAGPVVKCVVLRAAKDGDDDVKEDPPTTTDDSGDGESKVILESLIDEIEIDTTPAKSMVSKELGGPFTFLGQYEDEGIVLMVRSLPDELLEVDNELGTKKLSELRALCKELEIDMTGMLEKSDVLQAIESHLPPINPHSLQPPLQKAVVRGDIIAMRVAETKEELDGSGSEDENGESSDKLQVPSNDEFFKDYTKEEYVKFASRTDIEEHEVQISEADEGEEVEGDEQEEEAGEYDDDGEPAEPDDPNDGVFILGGDDTIEEEDKSAMFNLVMNEVLRQYREENGRGPNTQELLDLRATIAKELDVEVAHVEDADWDKTVKETPSGKKIGFHEEDNILEYHPHENEHNHHYLPADDDDENDHDSEEDDEDDSYEPPRKRLKYDADDDDEADSKPAAREAEDSKPAAIIKNGSKHEELTTERTDGAEASVTDQNSETTIEQ